MYVPRFYIMTRPNRRELHSWSSPLKTKSFSVSITEVHVLLTDKKQAKRSRWGPGEQKLIARLSSSGIKSKSVSSNEKYVDNNCLSEHKIMYNLLTVYDYLVHEVSGKSIVGKHMLKTSSHSLRIGPWCCGVLMFSTFRWSW